jgi:Holliday junction resolvase RusA-like endonuclease
MQTDIDQQPDTQPTQNQDTVFECRVFGTPRPKQSARFNPKTRRVVSAVKADPKKKLWSDTVTLAVKAALSHTGARAALNKDTPCHVELNFYIGTKDQKRFGLPHTAKPDADNLTKMVLDILEDSGVLPFGDQRVATLSVSKVWTSHGQAGVLVRVAHPHTYARERSYIKGTRPPSPPRTADEDGVPGWLSTVPGQTDG